MQLKLIVNDKMTPILRRFIKPYRVVLKNDRLEMHTPEGPQLMKTSPTNEDIAEAKKIVRILNEQEKK